MHLNGKNGKMLFNGNRQMDRRLMLMENFSSWGVVCPRPGAIYMYISIIMKLFFPETTWPIKAKLHMQHPWEGGGGRNYINGQGHMTKMAAMAINRKTLKIFFVRTRRPMILKLGVKHQ